MEVSNCVVESFFIHMYHKGLRSFLRSAIPFNYVRCILFQARKRSEIGWSCYKRTCSIWSRFGNSDNVGSINTTNNLSVEIKLKIILSTDAVFLSFPSYYTHFELSRELFAANSLEPSVWATSTEENETTNSPMSRRQKQCRPRIQWKNLVLVPSDLFVLVKFNWRDLTKDRDSWWSFVFSAQTNPWLYTKEEDGVSALEVLSLLF